MPDGSRAKGKAWFAFPDLIHETALINLFRSLLVMNIASGAAEHHIHRRRRRSVS